MDKTIATRLATMPDLIRPGSLDSMAVHNAHSVRKTHFAYGDKFAGLIRSLVPETHDASLFHRSGKDALNLLILQWMTFINCGI